MRRAAKTDLNQAEVVNEFRRLGASVQCLHSVGHGVPDLLVGYCGRNYLIEVKNGAKAGLTRDHQVLWHNRWPGQVDVVRFVSDVKTFMEGIK